MIQFRGICPGCNQLSLVDVYTSCSNVPRSGKPCGFRLTTTHLDGNQTYRAKFFKHTNPPAASASGDQSWSHSDAYDHYHECALASGQLFYDTVNKYFCLEFSPMGSGDAQIRYGTGGTSDAWHTIEPLNSKWPNLHPQFREHTSGLVPIATGDFTVAHSGIMVGGQEQRAYTIWQYNQPIAGYDPGTKQLIEFKFT